MADWLRKLADFLFGKLPARSNGDWGTSEEAPPPHTHRCACPGCTPDDGLNRDAMLRTPTEGEDATKILFPLSRGVRITGAEKPKPPRRKRAKSKKRKRGAP